MINIEGDKANICATKILLIGGIMVNGMYAHRTKIVLIIIGNELIY